MSQISIKSSIHKPFNAIVYGGDGDLAFRKIYPALFHRFVDDQLQCDFRIFPVTRSERKHATFFEDIKGFIRLSSSYEVDVLKLDQFLEKFQLFIIPEHTDENYEAIKKAIDECPTSFVWVDLGWSKNKISIAKANQK
jgi:glucose-6-phosphate 1-dehydrogenase